MTSRFFSNRCVSGKKIRKSNCNVNEKVIKIVAEYTRSILIAISKKRKSNCSGFAKT
jgi:hypothetical protein